MDKLNKKIFLKEVEEIDGDELFDKPLRTEPSKGIVAPSQKVISDVCEKEKFCKKQGPITFGQLRTLVETAQKKNLSYDIGEGVYKALIRLFPWFFPQIAVAGFVGSSIRAFNKIIKPGLEDTRGYKKWWGKTLMNIMDTVEGDLPHEDPISKIFFISDGLLHMLDRKFKIKFTRYIAEMAASKPDSEPVPEYFVENELRKWVNQKFLLNPPLPPKTLTESEDDDLNWIRDVQLETPLIYYKNLGYSLNDIIGFKVRIAETSRFYSDDDDEYTNPSYEIGVIYDTVKNSGLPIFVEWPVLDADDSRISNTYSWEDLICVGVKNNLNESEEDDWSWVRNIDPNTPVSFEDAEFEKVYRIEVDELLLNALEACDDEFSIYHYGTKGIVKKRTTLRYYEIYCDSDNDDYVTGLLIKFLNDQNEFIGDFWVSDDMVSLYQSLDNLNESEEDEWDWAKEIEVKTDLTPAQIYNRYETFPVEVVGPYIAGQFNDVVYEGGRLYLEADGWCDFVDLFEDRDSSYGYMGQYLAKAVLCDDDYWEPYDASDLVGNWINDVWDLVTDDEVLLEYIKKHIREGSYIGELLYSEEELREDMLEDHTLLGELINEDDMFYDLKMELKWAYGSAYNQATSNNIYESATDAVIDIFGKGEWIQKKNSRGYDVHIYKFDATDVILESVSKAISDCWSDCRRWYDPEKHYDQEEHENEQQAFEEYCDECVDKPFDEWGNFLEFYSRYLNDMGEELSPSYDEYPSNSDLKEYFREDVYSRI